MMNRQPHDFIESSVSGINIMGQFPERIRSVVEIIQRFHRGSDGIPGKFSGFFHSQK
jgi:hypothetical protein